MGRLQVVLHGKLITAIPPQGEERIISGTSFQYALAAIGARAQVVAEPIGRKACWSKSSAGSQQSSDRICVRGVAFSATTHKNILCENLPNMPMDYKVFEPNSEDLAEIIVRILSTDVRGLCLSSFIFGMGHVTSRITQYGFDYIISATTIGFFRLFSASRSPPWRSIDT